VYGSILVKLRKQRVWKWRFNMVFLGGYFFCHPLWKDPLIVRGVCYFHINGSFSILFLCFFRLFTGNKRLARMGSDFDFFLTPWIQCSPCFFFLPPHFFSNFLHTCCPVVFHICAMPYFLVILLLLLLSSSSLVDCFSGEEKGEVFDKMPKVLEAHQWLSLSLPLIMVYYTPAFL